MNKKHVIVCIALSSFFVGSAQSQESDMQHIEQEQNDERGNWYEKLQWWKKAGPEYVLIKQLAEKTKQESALAQKVLKELSVDVQKLYTDLRIDNAALMAAIAQKTNELKQEQEDADEQEHYSALIKKLEQLQEQNTAIQTWFKYAKHAINTTLAQQVSQAEAFEEKALESLDSLYAIHDDVKARRLYEVIINSKENIQNIVKYIAELNAYSKRAQSELIKGAATVKNLALELEKQNIILRDLTQEEKAQQAQALKKEQEARASRIAARNKSQEPQSWWQKIKAFFGF